MQNYERFVLSENFRDGLTEWENEQAVNHSMGAFGFARWLWCVWHVGENARQMNLREWDSAGILTTKGIKELKKLEKEMK